MQECTCKPGSYNGRVTCVCLNNAIEQFLFVDSVSKSIDPASVLFKAAVGPCKDHMDSRAARTLPKSETTEAQHPALKQHGGRHNVVLSSAGLSIPHLLPQAKGRLDIIEALMNP